MRFLASFNRVSPIIAAGLLGLFAAGIGAEIVVGIANHQRVIEEARV